MLLSAVLTTGWDEGDYLSVRTTSWTLNLFDDDLSGKMVVIKVSE
jgi:hypothetical protein